MFNGGGDDPDFGIDVVDTNLIRQQLSFSIVLSEYQSSLFFADANRGMSRRGSVWMKSRPQARTVSTEVTSPMGEDDPRRGHLAHGRGPTSRPETVHPRLSSRNTILGPLDAIPMSRLA
ncbi:hypothetical protein DY000_02004911 [Brassica cretica]|uniref:Uncharacterized protein n=1 Tax=Brassica cretica TaxID=69181 RepID=A0ABQ7C495_BRACR|nr:hypothetical protein DY000_02004911 [Brassica cretica]